eukprot:TRINITY_DN54754_c0_g1_i1.p1 TRINITY_DN54754_c0_g1~~TRINITY_DN54754_c0_g1_i1.p1  ORF type:complete len:137 (-),score=9.80 TRINITY_DN54754_c0_g1_i1:6-368(-)
MTATKREIKTHCLSPTAGDVFFPGGIDNNTTASGTTTAHPRSSSVIGADNKKLVVPPTEMNGSGFLSLATVVPRFHDQQPSSPNHTHNPTSASRSTYRVVLPNHDKREILVRGIPQLPRQ